MVDTLMDCIQIFFFFSALAATAAGGTSCAMGSFDGHVPGLFEHVYSTQQIEDERGWDIPCANTVNFSFDAVLTWYADFFLFKQNLSCRSTCNAPILHCLVQSLILTIDLTPPSSVSPCVLCMFTVFFSATTLCVRFFVGFHFLPSQLSHWQASGVLLFLAIPDGPLRYLPRAACDQVSFVRICPMGAKSNKPK